MKFSVILGLLLGTVAVQGQIINVTPPVFPTVNVNALLAGVGSTTATNNRIDSVLSNALSQVPDGLSAVSGGSTNTTPISTEDQNPDIPLQDQLSDDIIYLDQFGNPITPVDKDLLISRSNIFITAPPEPQQLIVDLAAIRLQQILNGGA